MFTVDFDALGPCSSVLLRLLDLWRRKMPRIYHGLQCLASPFSGKTYRQQVERVQFSLALMPHLFAAQGGAALVRWFVDCVYDSLVWKAGNKNAGVLPHNLWRFSDVSRATKLSFSFFGEGAPWTGRGVYSSDLALAP